MMQAAGDTTVAQPSYDGFVHVSLTVTVRYPLEGANMTGDYVKLVFVHADESGAKTLCNDEYYWIIPSVDTACGKATKTIEFDAAKADAEPYSWKLVACNAQADDEDDAWAVGYTYTMTYPARQ